MGFNCNVRLYDLEVLEGQLWNLTGAVGGLGAGGTGTRGVGGAGAGGGGKGAKGGGGAGGKGNGGTRLTSAGPATRHRLLRGGAHHWVMGGDVRVMCAAGVDGSELWWASNRATSLSAYDLFLQSQRNIDGLVMPGRGVLRMSTRSSSPSDESSRVCTCV